MILIYTKRNYCSNINLLLSQVLARGIYSLSGLRILHGHVARG